MKYCSCNHTFVLCAYGDSPYLEECLMSLTAQSVKTNIVVATSTPSDYVRNTAEKYSAPVFINSGEKGISGDWNFAASCADTELVTIAHQDDIYLPDYAETMLDRINSAEAPIIFFSDYAELRETEVETDNLNLRIKRILLKPISAMPGSVAARRLSLSLGNPICCPSVTYVKKFLSEHPFISGMRSDVDWQEWETLSKIQGSFVMSDKMLMYHRIHTGSETSNTINDHIRSDEDLEMFRKFWPEPFARLIGHIYSKNSEKSNKL